MPEVCVVDHSAQLGGAELALERYLRWPDRSHRVHLVVFEEGPLTERLRGVEALTVTVLEGDSVAARVRALSRLLRSHRGVVMANSLSAYLHLSLVPRLRGRLVCFLRQEAFPEDAGAAKLRFLRHVAYPRAYGFLANSRWSLETLPPRLLSRPHQVVYTVSGVHRDQLRPPAQEAADPLRVLSLSRLSPWKGVHVICEAVLELNATLGRTAATLTLAGGDLFGEPQYAQRLRGLAERSAGAITMVGNVSDVPRVLAEHDVLVSASVTPEPFGQILVQGLGAGLLTIGTAHGGAQEIVQDGRNGLMVPQGDPQALAGALRWALEHPAEVRGLREAGARSAARFTDERTLPLLDRALERLSR